MGLIETLDKFDVWFIKHKNSMVGLCIGAVIGILLISTINYFTTTDNNEESQYSCVAGCMAGQNYNGENFTELDLGDLYLDSQLHNDSMKCVDFCEVIVIEVQKVLK